MKVKTWGDSHLVVACWTVIARDYVVLVFCFVSI